MNTIDIILVSDSLEIDGVFMIGFIGAVASLLGLAAYWEYMVRKHAKETKEQQVKRQLAAWEAFEWSRFRSKGHVSDSLPTPVLDTHQIVQVMKWQQ